MKKTGRKRSPAPKLSAIDKTLADIRARFGTTALMRFGERQLVKVDVVPTGSMALDRAIGVGGYPLGRIVELYGHESGGKTTMSLHGIANAQALGHQVAFVDAEHAFDPFYAKAIGVDMDNLLFSQPDSGEQALDVVEALVSSGDVRMVVIDSVTALTPQAEIDGDMSQQTIGLQARLLSLALRKLCSKAYKNNCCVLFVNQVRDNIGVTFGARTSTTGGRALKFYASLRLDVGRRGLIKQGVESVGNFHLAKVTKNKLAPPFREAEFEMLFGKGIDRTGDLINVAVNSGVIDQRGSWYSFEGTKLCQGRFSLHAVLEKDAKLRARVEEGARQVVY